jgi:hypothetical protein
MNWEKKGLIFVPSEGDDAMKSHAAIPFADVIDDSTVRVYFSSRNKKGYSIPYYLDVDIHNPRIIKDVSQPILPLGDLGTFDECGIMPSWITNFEGKKYLYYIAWNPQVTVSYRLSIGLAVSEDGGKTYSKFSIAPVCDRSLHEPYFNTAPCVLYIDGIWKMWYISCTKWQIVNNYPEPQYHVKYAESQDGVNWVKKNIVCIDYDDWAEAIGRPSVIYEDNVYKMFYSYRRLKDYRTDKNASYRIGFAVSKDGIHWEKHNEQAGISFSEEGWDSHMMEYCHVVKIRDRYLMFYNGNGFGQSGFGYAESLAIS